MRSSGWTFVLPAPTEQDSFLDNGPDEIAIRVRQMPEVIHIIRDSLESTAIDGVRDAVLFEEALIVLRFCRRKTGGGFVAITRPPLAGVPSRAYKARLSTASRAAVDHPRRTHRPCSDPPDGRNKDRATVQQSSAQKPGLILLCCDTERPQRTLQILWRGFRFASGVATKMWQCLGRGSRLLLFL